MFASNDTVMEVCAVLTAGSLPEVLHDVKGKGKGFPYSIPSVGP